MPRTIPVTYCDPKNDKSLKEWGDTKIFLPSQWMTSFATTPSLECEYDAMFGISKLDSFWNSVDVTSPLFAAVIKKPNYKTRAIPIVLHGDGAAYQDRDSMLSVSMTGFLKEGRTLETSLLLVISLQM